MIMHLLFLLVLSAFYLLYLAKLVDQRRQGIRTNLLGKGEKPTKARNIERVLKIVTYACVAVQYASVIVALVQGQNTLSLLWIIGFVLCVLGVVCFRLSTSVMRSNWRVGLSADQQTTLVTDGIYRISRNPAFLGFDLLYIGCALAYPNLINLFFPAAAIVLLHLQILQEEAFLTDTFGAAYTRYAQSVRRYLGRR